MSAEVSVITVTYNSAACIGECLASLRGQQGVEIELVLVDNASSDNTLAVARQAGSGLRLIANQENRGFGAACNQGFAASQGRFVYLLNPDAQLLGDNALALLCQALDGRPQWGMAGTAILAANGKPKGPPNSDYPARSLTRSNFSHLPGQIAWVIGASMFIRREVYRALGGFDPEFFLYGEDIDFCLRLRKHGYEIGFVEEVQVRHTGAASEKTQDPFESAMRRTRGTYLFWSKHYEPNDVAQLVRRDYRRARYQKALNGLLALVRPAHSVSWHRYRRYAGICESAARFLMRDA